MWLTTFPKRLTMMLLPTTSKAWRSWNRDYHFEQKRRGYSSRKLAQAFCLHLVSGTQTLNKEKPLKNKRREEAGRRHFAAPLTADVRAYSTRRTLVGGGGTAAATPTLLLHSGSKQLKSAKIKVHIFWEGHKILRNLPLTFDCMYCSSTYSDYVDM